ncbi:MAG: hypothetical protein ABIP64_14590 [Burkholderiales bacterium]
MAAKKTRIAVLLATVACFAFSVTAHAEYDLGCDLEKIQGMITWCIDPAQKDLSKLQQGGRDNILKGRFCEKPTFVADGIMSCFSHDIDQLKVILACHVESHLKAAKAAIPETETRKPADCRGNI